MEIEPVMVVEHMSDSVTRTARRLTGAVTLSLSVGAGAMAQTTEAPAAVGAAVPLQPAAPVPLPAVDAARFDSTVSPCDDFYRYVNGGWAVHDTAAHDRFGVPYAESRVEELETVYPYVYGDQAASASVAYGPGRPRTVDDAVRRVESLLWRLVEEARQAAPVSSDSAVRTIGTFYDDCLRDTTGTMTAPVTADPGAVGGRRRAAACYGATLLKHADAFDAVYARRFFPPAWQDQAESAFVRLKQAAARRLGATPWLSARAKAYEIAWLDTLPTRVGGSDSPASLWAPFGTVPNGITPAALLPPFFDPQSDPASNYGGLHLLAHELMHSFDQPDNQSGRSGPRRFVWTEADSVEFRRRERVILALYAAHPELDVGPRDNHADIGGLLVAYDALQEVLQGRPRERIAGLTPEQRFFVAFATVWAYVYRTPVSRMAYRPGLVRNRVNNALRNVTAFAEAFGCEAGDAMVRPKAERVELYGAARP